MRISSFGQFNFIQKQIQDIQGDMSKQQWQVSSGKEYQRSSENPISAKKALVVNEAINQLDQFKKNGDDAMSMLQTMEDALLSAQEMLRYVNEEALRGSNGTVSNADLQTIASAVESSIQQVVAIANTKHLNRFVFSGEKILTKPIDYDGNSAIYNGNTTNVGVQLSQYLEVEVTGDGQNLFVKTINDLVALRDALSANDKTGIQNGLLLNQQNMNKIVDEVADIGTRMSSIQLAEESIAERKLNLQSKLRDIEDVDFTETMAEYMMTQRTYQATIQAGSMMLKVNILDYI